MSKHWDLVSLGRVIKSRKQFIQIDDLKTYKRCRVQCHAQGIVLRDIVQGTEIKTKKQQLCKNDDFLVAEIDAKMGGFGLVPQELDGAIVSSHYFLYEIDGFLLNKNFLNYFIRTPFFRDQVFAQGSTNYAAIRPNDVLGYQIPLPPLEEQHRLVARIEELASKIEEARSLKDQALKDSQALWLSNLVYTFQEANLNYPHKKFREVCNVVRGGSPRPAGSPLYYDGHIPFLKVGDLTKDESKYLFSYNETIKEAGLTKTRYIEANNLLLTNSGATLGIPKITTFATTFNDGIQAFLNLPNDISKEYLYYYLRSKTIWFRKEAARGQGQPNLNTDMVKRMSFPFPPISEQNQIVAYLDKLQNRIAEMNRLREESLKQLDALLPSILDQAFKGEL